jgi:hypothetical protein
MPIVVGLPAPNVGFTVVLWYARLPAQLLHRIFSNDIF